MPKFAPGEIVALRADPSRTGPVMQVLPPLGGVPRYRVFHASGDMGEYLEDQLLAVDANASEDPLAEAIATGTHVATASFAARLTAARLTHPSSEELYALHAARIKFIPFQFKPVLRMLRADRPRLLIADEVGVGKTIEAGLIMRELRARQKLDPVLVVCPKALTTKWKREMERFDERFEILDARLLRYCLRIASEEGSWPSQFARSIVHIELLRRDEYLHGLEDERKRRPGFATLDPVPTFGMFILDEAHHVRTPGRRAHEITRFLCSISEAVVFLSATPIQVGSENLFSLLNLLRPDLFGSSAAFKELLEPNPHLHAAVRALRSPQLASWNELVADALARAAETRWGQQVLAQDPVFSMWRARLTAGPVGDSDRIRCIRDVEEMSSFANVINRTRRRDIGRFTLRDPQTVSVPFTESQERLYRAVIDFQSEVYLLQHDPLVVRLILDTIERQATSCLHALATTIETVIQRGLGRISELWDLEPEEDVAEALPETLEQALRRLEQAAAALDPEDPKLERLVAIARQTEDSDGPGKLLVFSYFIHTLHYLERSLLRQGLRVGLITGTTKEFDRQALRDRFRLPRADPNAVDVLLSSEVGCEGLDYEFCDRLVNYDLPWNPMRVEQRIGRIDRFGQQAPKVLIFNFITPGTVEERVYHRCYERLGIFNDALGDLEEVLGNLVEELGSIRVDPSLSPEQIQKRALQAADNTLRLVEENRRFEQESASLTSLDGDLAAETEDLEGRGKLVTPADIERLVRVGLAEPKWITLSPTGEDGICMLEVTKNGMTELQRELARSRHMLGIAGRELKEKLKEQAAFEVTFDQDVAVARRDVVFLTPLHPLVRVAAAMVDGSTAPLATAVVLRGDAFHPGDYLFACDIWETVGARAEARLVTHCVSLTDPTLSRPLSPDLLSKLATASQWENAPDLDLPMTKRLLASLDEDLDRQRRRELTRVEKRNDALVRQRRTNLEIHFERRRDRLTAEIEGLTSEKVARMKRSELARVEREYEEKLEELERCRRSDIIPRRLAVGLLRVEHGD